MQPYHGNQHGDGQPLSLERKVVLVNILSIPIFSHGGISYWLVPDYRWNVKLSLQPGHVFMCKEVTVEEEVNLRVIEGETVIISFVSIIN